MSLLGKGCRGLSSLGPQCQSPFQPSEAGTMPASPTRAFHHPPPEASVQNTLTGTHPPTGHCNHIHAQSFDPVQTCPDLDAHIPLSGPHSSCLHLTSGAACTCSGGVLPPCPPPSTQGARHCRASLSPLPRSPTIFLLSLSFPTFK